MKGKSKSYIGKLEEERKKAFESRDARIYFLACEELGIEPEAQELYEQGQLELKLESDEEEELLHKKLDRKSCLKYMNFYTSGRPLNEKDFRKDVELKRRLLVSHFPGRFGKNGKQSLENLTELQIGSLFKKIMEYSDKRIHQ